MPKYGVSFDPYFPAFSPNTGKYGLEKTPYLDNFHAVEVSIPEYDLLKVYLISMDYAPLK